MSIVLQARLDIIPKNIYISTQKLPDGGFYYLKMSTNESFKNQLHARLSEMRENTIIVDQIELFHLADIEEGVVIVWANWCGPAIANCMATINYLDSLNYSGRIYIVDNDDFNAPEKNYNLFGKILHGWGEIFIIKDGLITNEFLGKESFSRFKMYLQS